MSLSQMYKLSQPQTCHQFGSLWCDLYCLTLHTGQLVSLRLGSGGVIRRTIQSGVVSEMSQSSPGYLSVLSPVNGKSSDWLKSQRGLGAAKLSLIWQ